MSAPQHYEVITEPTRDGTNILVFPPIPVSFGSPIRRMLHKHIALTDTGPLFNVLQPVHIDHEQYGEGTRIYVHHHKRASTFDGMTRRILLLLNGNEDTPPADLQTLYERASQPIVENIEVSEEYL